MLGAAQQLIEQFNNLQFIIPIAPGLCRKEIEKLTAGFDFPLTMVTNSIYEVIDTAHLVIVTSGTATLETALLSTPMVIVYKMSPLSYHIGKKLIKVPYIGMANILAGKKVVPELIQEEATASNIAGEVSRLLHDVHYYQQVCKELSSIKNKLGKPGASKRAAHIAVNMLYN